MGVVNIGTAANDGTGDSLRVGMDKVNDAFIDYVAGTITPGSVTTTMLEDNGTTNAKLRDSAALSVIGRSANSSGDPADIAAATDGDILRRSGTSIGFGRITGANVDFTQTGTGAVSQTLDAWMKSKALSAFDFMTTAQIADVQARTTTLNVISPINSLITACLAQKKAAYFPAGKYRIDSAWFINTASALTNGITILGDGVQNTLFDMSNVATSPNFLLYASGGTPSSPVSQTYANIFDVGFTGNINGNLVQIGQADFSDHINLPRLRIWAVNNNTGSSTTNVELNACYGGAFEINGVTGSNPREILTLGAITGGAGYANATYTNVPLTGGTGNFATANITVSGGAVTAVTLVSKGFGFTVADTLSASAANLGGAGAGFSVPVATVRTTTSCALRLNQVAFSKFFVSLGGANRAVHITNGYNYGNTFISPDFEICDYGAIIDSANASSNTFIGGTWAYYVEGLRGVAGANNIAVNPNVNSGAAFITSATGVSRFDQTTMAPLAGPTFTGTAAAPTFNATTSVTLGGATVVDGSAGLRFPSYTAAQIADKTHAVNTANKAAGKAVFDTTNTRIMVATGATDVSTWKVADNSATVTPV